MVITRSTTALLEAREITKRFHDYLALEDVGFEITEGEILGLIGPNGSGKTTLLEIVCGLLTADRQAVRWRGRPLAPARRREVMFYVPDGIAPYAEHATSDVLDFFAGVYRVERANLDGVIEQLALTPALGKRVGALSKGYRRRLLLALGLIAPQPLLLMDEPFDGFDLRQTRDVMAFMRSLAGKGGRTMLLSIHQLGVAERMCDRFVLLSGGRVRGQGRLDELRALAGPGPAGTGWQSLEGVFLALT